MIMTIDNYDSFTYNLVQYLRQMGAEVHVARNDALSVKEIEDLCPAGIIISPGPGRPEAAGVSMAVIQRFSGQLPILGVCLGHQAVGAAFGAEIVPAGRLMHGKTSAVTCDGRTIFHRIPSPFTAMRYHSLAVSQENLPSVLEISAESEDGEIMGIRHREHSTEGIQFHPESIMTNVGKRILRNFLKITQKERLSA
jgi:anthranilate synthase/aminodeoxychorismate synthase-like glutamine amidotransferase